MITGGHGGKLFSQRFNRNNTPVRLVHSSQLNRPGIP
jgi:hypothetical protein